MLCEIVPFFPYLLVILGNAFNPSCSLIRVHWLDDKNVFLQFNNVDGATMALDPKSFPNRTAQKRSQFPPRRMAFPK